jgi:nucleoside-diphosphate-sugar epimerase
VLMLVQAADGTNERVRVLVAGGAGFIGSHVCKALLDHGHSVLCIDNLLTGSRTNVEGLLGDPRFDFMEADIVEPLQPAPEVGLVLHLASPASPVHYKTYAIETMLANSQGTQRLLETARESAARFVFASTSEVYGDPLEHPQRESYWGNVNPIGPRACYDESKRFGEAFTFEYRRRYAVNASVVRIFNTYGPQMSIADGRVVPAFIGAALSGQPLPVFGDGRQTRSFCYVSDLVDGMLRLAMDASADGEVFNMGNPNEITMLELAETVSRLTGQAASTTLLERGQDDPGRRKPDISRMRERYGWEPEVSLEDGMRRTIDYFRAVLAVPAEGGA